MSARADRVSTLSQNKAQLLGHESQMTKQAKERLSPISKAFNHEEIITSINTAWNSCKNAPYFT